MDCADTVLDGNAFQSRIADGKKDPGGPGQSSNSGARIAQSAQVARLASD